MGEREDLGVRKGSCIDCGRINVDIVPIGGAGVCFNVEDCERQRKKSDNVFDVGL